MLRHLEALGHYGYLLIQAAAYLPWLWRDRQRVLYQLELAGVRSLPLVLLLGFFTGSIMAWQAAYQFTGLASLDLLGGQTFKVIIMEVGPVLTALIMAGRLGASMAAEIGSMRITEQIDALRTLSLDPNRYIVMPRIVALAVMMPFLTIFSNVTGTIGAYVVASSFLGITSTVFLDSIQQFFSFNEILGGLLKAFIFGIIIASTGCYMGLQTGRGAQGVGRATIQAFVAAAIAILISDYLLWLILF